MTPLGLDALLARLDMLREKVTAGATKDERVLAHEEFSDAVYESWRQISSAVRERDARIAELLLQASSLRKQLDEEIRNKQRDARDAHAEGVWDERRREEERGTY